MDKRPPTFRVNLTRALGQCPAMEQNRSVRVAIPVDDILHLPLAKEAHRVKHVSRSRIGNGRLRNQRIEHHRVEDDRGRIQSSFPRGIDDGLIAFGRGLCAECRDFGVCPSGAAKAHRERIKQVIEPAIRTLHTVRREEFVRLPEADVITDVIIRVDDSFAGLVIGHERQNRAVVLLAECAFDGAIAEQDAFLAVQHALSQNGCRARRGNAVEQRGCRRGTAVQSRIDNRLVVDERQNVIMAISNLPLFTHVFGQNLGDLLQLSAELKREDQVAGAEVRSMQHAPVKRVATLSRSDRHHSRSR